MSIDNDDIRQIIKKHRDKQDDLLRGVDDFRAMGITHKVAQLEGKSWGLGSVCEDLEELIGE